MVVRFTRWSPEDQYWSEFSYYKKTKEDSSVYRMNRRLFPVFEQVFEDYCLERAKKLITYRNDLNLFGYFLDNELSFAGDMLDAYLTLDHEDDNYKATVGRLEDDGSATNDAPTDKIRDEFLAFVLNRYLSVTTKAIRIVCPNHVILGSPFYWNDRLYLEKDQSSILTNPLVFETDGIYLDVVSCNYYFLWTLWLRRLILGQNGQANRL